MTLDTLSRLVAVYRAGLVAELGLLEQLRTLSAAIQEASTAPDMAVVEGMTDERECLMATLLTLEHELLPTREQLWARREEASERPEFVEVAALHGQASDLISTIITADRETLRALQRAESARRALAQDLEVGETTLAAYRRVIAPSVGSAALMTRRG